jgi:osmotically-inducible protein OsmY
MKTNNMGRTAAAASSLVLLLALGACGDRVENTEMPQPQQANVEINRQGMEGAKDEQQAIGVENHDNAREMGAAAASAGDPDDRISKEVKSALAADPAIGTLPKIDVHSEDGAVTLRGQAPDPQARERATEVARGIGGVKSVDNQLTLG